ncbi:DUF1570 domain-containing protein [Dasania sp. GY-MA-18]|uniref:DUF1570 domain-containing protein n=1 Tax=Dasania phycosphaerae TaxID=2950436 RepID=A0A9J6RJ39_9GAMM|nr:MULTISPECIES: DUF1570 domain-containing protein [Dasania]MCR8922282.1 DUF1570 domain-containing protein [Dasania sp. GY-MA-18]MCZ0864710.1 DUF1570 domain-containing protein [Dasania phycosphaerae]MCZ0868438.1 DUF1570 domain-containing protein [Dasania phycosphaerae]
MFKSLLRIVIVLAVITLISWPFLSAERKKLLISMASGQVNWQQLQLVNPFTQKTMTPVGSLVGRINQQIGSTELGKELLANWHGPQQYRCEPIATRDIRDTTQKKMYRWQDDKGRWHFGDDPRLVSPQAEEVGSRYQSKYQFFTLNLLGDDKQLPAFSRDRISAESRQIFTVLSDALAVDYLRQVDLNLRLLASQEDFQALRDQTAPNLQTNTGFYSTSNNEAVIWQAPDREFMYGVIRHEASHVIMAGLYGYPPVWVNEGMAEYFELLSLQGNAKTISPNNNWLNYLRQQGAMPLADYLALAPNEWYAGTQEQMYAMAWSLVYFFMAEPQRKQFFATMLASMAANKCQQFASIDYMQGHYPQGVAGLQQDWQQWLQRGSPAPHYY